jgi:hypothetical protein
MQMRAILIALVACVSVGCGDDGHDPTPYTLYQDCFNEHSEDEMLQVFQSILACCIDHPIAGMQPACGETEADCINYLTANLNQTSASTTQVMESCTSYVDMK